MHIPDFVPFNDQMSQLGKNKWSVVRLVQLSKDFPIQEVPIDALNVYKVYERITVREMVMHLKAVLAADLSFPIILDEDGDIMDGRHRVMKALLEGRKTIKMVRFDTNPYPCAREEDL